jgi:hypothetical protein
VLGCLVKDDSLNLFACCTPGRAVFGDAVRITTGQGGGSRQIAQGAAAYVLQLLEQRRKQQKSQQAENAEQQQLQLGPVSMPVGMHICTKVTFR